jgi:hypothetical protein
MKRESLVAAQLGALVEEVGVLGVGPVGHRRRHHHHRRRARGGARVQDVHRADVLELVGPLGGVGRVRQERAVDDGVDLLALEQGRDLAVDRRLGQVDREEPRLGRAGGQDRRRLDVEDQHLGVAAIFFEPLDQLGAQVGARAGDRDDALPGRGADVRCRRRRWPSLPLYNLGPRGSRVGEPRPRRPAGRCASGFRRRRRRATRERGPRRRLA